MKGVCVSRDSNGIAILVTVRDDYGNSCVYSIPDYEARGYEPDWRTLPTEADLR